MQLEAASGTHVGNVRTTNEDVFICDASRGIFAVCDGMGGGDAGEVAARMAANSILRAFARYQPSARHDLHEVAERLELLRFAVARASTEIYEAARSARREGCGTTCTAMVADARHAVLAHAGDSRCYLLRAGLVTQLTADHTYVAEAIRQGILSPKDAENAPFRNVLTRALGPHGNVVVDKMSFELAAGDMLLLASDGLWRYVPDANELVTLLQGREPEAIVANLLRIGRERGGADNLTAVVVRVPLRAHATRVGTIRRIEALRHVDLFSALDMAETIRLHQAFETRDLDVGEVVVREGDRSDELFVLADGSVEVLRGGDRIATLGAGSHFGEMAMLAQRPRTATVRAIEISQVLVARRAVLLDLLSRDTALAAKIFFTISRVLSARLEDLVQMVAPTATSAGHADSSRTVRPGELS